jgi:hypothetical protein
VTYAQDFLDSARRHLQAGDALFNAPPHSQRLDVAGYLYGVAAECALKELMRRSGMAPLPEQQRRDDPFYKHFPELKTSIRDTATGRHQGNLLRFAAGTNDAFMSEWSTDMRYAPRTLFDEGNKEAKRKKLEARCTAWRADAMQILDVVEEL